MSATITISPSEIRQIFQPRTSSASRFWELAQKANNLAVIVEARWEQIPADTRELLKIFAYALIEPPQGIKGVFIELLGRFYLAFSLFSIAIKGEQDAFIAYAGAFKRLLNAILRGLNGKILLMKKHYPKPWRKLLQGWKLARR